MPQNQKKTPEFGTHINNFNSIPTGCLLDAIDAIVGEMGVHDLT